MSGINGIIECNMSCECSLGNKLDTRPSTEQIASSMLYHGSNWHCGMKKVWLVRLAKEPEVITYFKASLGWLRVFKSSLMCFSSFLKKTMLLHQHRAGGYTVYCPISAWRVVLYFVQETCLNGVYWRIIQIFQLSHLDRETPGMRHLPPVPRFYHQMSRRSS